jgi:hypothetical protein
MKTVAHSIVPSHPVPYMHLGYISAVNLQQTSDVPGGGALIGLGLTMVVAGAVLVTNITKHLPALRKGGIALLVLGILCCAVSAFGPWPARYKYPERATYDRAWKMQDRLNAQAQIGEVTADNVADLIQHDSLLTAVRSDAWGRPMRVTITGSGKEAVAAVTSAGPDGIFATPDDIVVTKGSPPVYQKLTDATVGTP